MSSGTLNPQKPFFFARRNDMSILYEDSIGVVLINCYAAVYSKNDHRIRSDDIAVIAMHLVGQIVDLLKSAEFLRRIAMLV